MKTMKKTFSPPKGGPAEVAENMRSKETGYHDGWPSAPDAAIPAAPAPSYKTWSAMRLVYMTPCTLEPMMDCLPLTCDPICRACYEDNKHIPIEVTDEQGH